VTSTPTPVRLDELITALQSVHPDALDQLADAVQAAEHLGEVADHLIGHFVDQARRSTGITQRRHEGLTKVHGTPPLAGRACAIMRRCAAG
jgi:hypothetical protein